MNDDQISMNDAQEWARQFDVTVQQVRDAIDTVGPNKAEVEMYLKGSHSSTDGDVARNASA